MTAKVSTAKIALAAAIFCAVAGFSYGLFETYPVNAFGKGLMAFGTALFWLGIVYGFMIHRQGKQYASLLIAIMFSTNVCLWICALRFCEPQCKTIGYTLGSTSSTSSTSPKR